MVENYDEAKFTRLFQRISRIDDYNNRKSINKTLTKCFLDVWDDMLVNKGYNPMIDDAPGKNVSPCIIFTYCWLKVWADAERMSLDQLNKIKALADQEMEYVNHHIRGRGLSPVSFMPMIIAQLDQVITIINCKTACKSFVTMLLCRERYHSNKIMVEGGLPSNTLKLIGDALFKILEDAQMVQRWSRHRQSTWSRHRQSPYL